MRLDVSWFYLHFGYNGFFDENHCLEIGWSRNQNRQETYPIWKHFYVFHIGVWLQLAIPQFLWTEHAKLIRGKGWKERKELASVFWLGRCWYSRGVAWNTTSTESSIVNVLKHKNGTWR